MYNMIERLMNNITKEQINNFAIKKNIMLSEEELQFTYLFVKKNWKDIISNPTLLNLERYKDYFSNTNFVKIQKLFNEYSAKYKNII